jgi:hypothetical protein
MFARLKRAQPRSTHLKNAGNGAGDISGNLYEEVGVLADKPTDGKVAIQLKDYDDRKTNATIFP